MPHCAYVLFLVEIINLLMKLKCVKLFFPEICKVDANMRNFGLKNLVIFTRHLTYLQKSIKFDFWMWQNTGKQAFVNCLTYIYSQKSLYIMQINTLSNSSLLRLTWVKCNALWIQLEQWNICKFVEFTNFVDEWKSSQFFINFVVRTC